MSRAEKAAAAVDFVVNSSHEYEVRVLKPLVEPLLMAVPPTDVHYEKARSLLQMLALISAAPTCWGFIVSRSEPEK